jgi:hypothetical protein
MTSRPAKTKPRPRLFAWLGRILLGAIVLLIVALMFGAIYQAIGERRDRANFRPPDRWWMWAATSFISTALGRQPNRDPGGFSGGMSPIGAGCSRPLQNTRASVRTIGPGAPGASHGRMRPETLPGRQRLSCIPCWKRQGSRAPMSWLAIRSAASMPAWLPLSTAGGLRDRPTRLRPSRAARPLPGAAGGAEAYQRQSSVFPFWRGSGCSACISPQG